MPAPSHPIPRPNVLMIVMDDQRADTFGGINHRFLQTPRLSALAREGVRLTNVFATVPICTPGRAELLTGCHSFQNGVTWFGQPIDPRLVLMPQAFAAAGYHTIHVGKWHNDGHPRDRGYRVVRRNLFDAVDFYRRYPTHGHHLRFAEEGGVVEGHSSELFTDALLEELPRTPSGQPWFAWLAYHSPHDPFDCPPLFRDLYRDESRLLPEDYAPEPVVDNGDLTIRDELLLPWPRTPEQISRYRARYYAMISHHDAQIGRILDHLAQTGQDAHTWVVFCSDHGLAVGSHGLLGKENMYDHSCRVPCVLRGPGVRPGLVLEGMARNTDLYPTVAELCGVPRPDTVADGRSLAPLLRGESRPDLWREQVGAAFRSPPPGDPAGTVGPLRETQRMIRTDCRKLTFFPGSGLYQLFDLAADPLERHDLLRAWRARPSPRWGWQPARDSAEWLGEAEALRERLRQWMIEVGDPARPALEATPVRLSP